MDKVTTSGRDVRGDTSEVSMSDLKVIGIILNENWLRYRCRWLKSVIVSCLHLAVRLVKLTYLHAFYGNVLRC